MSLFYLKILLLIFSFLYFLNIVHTYWLLFLTYWFIVFIRSFQKLDICQRRSNWWRGKYFLYSHFFILQRGILIWEVIILWRILCIINILWIFRTIYLIMKIHVSWASSIYMFSIFSSRGKLNIFIWYVMRKSSKTVSCEADRLFCSKERNFKSRYIVWSFNCIFIKLSCFSKISFSSFDITSYFCNILL